MNIGTFQAEEKYATASPVLFLIFNRPDTTQRVFQAIRQAKPPRLYIAADGPRNTRSDDSTKCEAARRVVASIDWECEVRTLFRSENLGCRTAVHEALQWFFESEQEGIILEDDCVPVPMFFEYCDRALDAYRDCLNVAAICGRNEEGVSRYLKEGHAFSRKFRAWGWASWADRIRDLDVNAGEEKSAFRRTVSGIPIREKLLVRRYFNSISSGNVSAWDWPYEINFRNKKQLVVYPAYNLVEYIGFGENATHTSRAQDDTVPVFNQRINLLPIEPVEDPRVLRGFFRSRKMTLTNLLISAYPDAFQVPRQIYRMFRKKTRQVIQ